MKQESFIIAKDYNTNLNFKEAESNCTLAVRFHLALLKSTDLHWWRASQTDVLSVVVHCSKLLAFLELLVHPTHLIGPLHGPCRCQCGQRIQPSPSMDEERDDSQKVILWTDSYHLLSNRYKNWRRSQPWKLNAKLGLKRVKTRHMTHINLGLSTNLLCEFGP